MDQNSLPPLPTAEELFAPTTSKSSSLPFLKNVNHFIPVPPLPPQYNAYVPPMPPSDPYLEYTEPCSPVPPQPTSPLVDRFDYQLGEYNTNDSVFQLEQSKSSDVSSRELLSGGPPSKKARYGEAAEAASLLEYDSREEGEISDEEDDVDQATIRGKPTSSHHKPLSQHLTSSHNDHNPHSSSHRRVPTDCSQNIAKTSSSHHRHSRGSDVTRKSSRHRHRVPPHSLHSSHHHHHSLQSDLPHNKGSSKDASRMSVCQPSLTGELETTKKDGSETVCQHQPSSPVNHSHNRGLSGSILRSPRIRHAPAGSTLVSEIVKNMSRSSVGPQTSASTSLDKNDLQHQLTDSAAADRNTLKLNNQQQSVNSSKASYSGITKDDSQYLKSHPSSHRSDSFKQIKTSQSSCQQPNKMYEFTAVKSTENLSSQTQVRERFGTSPGKCQIPYQQSVISVPRPAGRTALAATGHSLNDSRMLCPQKDLDAPYSPGSLDIDVLFKSSVASGLREGVLNDDSAGNNIDMVSVPCSDLVSSTEPNGEITNMNAKDSIVEVDTDEIVGELPAGDEVEMVTESAAVEGLGQEYEIIDDLDSNADDVDDSVVVSSDNSDVELDSGEDERVPDKYVKLQRRQRSRKTGEADEHLRNSLELCDEDGDKYQAPIVNNKIVLHGESKIRHLLFLKPMLVDTLLQ